MNKFFLKLLLIAIILISIVSILNISVITRQGINYQVQEIRMPLFLKFLNFVDRHYNYTYLVKKIIADKHSEEEKAMALFVWAYENIRKQPKELPVVDDHVWHIIVRGYGVNDQSNDVFTVLCNYAGLDAFYNWVDAKSHDYRIVLSLVRINGAWRVFDSYNGIYFKNREGKLADIEEIIRGDWEEIGLIDKKSGVDYAGYFKNLLPVRGIGLKRVNTQSPINRLRYEIKKWLR